MSKPLSPALVNVGGSRQPEGSPPEVMRHTAELWMIMKLPPETVNSSSSVGTVNERPSLRFITPTPPCAKRRETA